MPTYFQRPENALKRANEFIDVGKKQRALDALYDVIKSKKHRTWQKIHEPIMEKYLELCVELRKSHVAKEGLYQYKNICQQVNIQSLVDVVRKYISLAEEQTELARKESHQTVLDIDDLDLPDSPESLLLKAVSGEDTQDRTDRAILTPWVKFLWESYRQCLDLLRNNCRVERLYQDIAQQAFKFCLKYARKTEFRKLCDNLRTHLGHIHKHQHQQTAINLNNPDSQAMHLETRLEQLNSAINMELWQEAFKAVEDIHGLIILSKKSPKPSLMANYLQKFGLVFWKSGNHLFHACTLHRIFHLSREQRKNLTTEELQKMASRVVCATLAIPIATSRNTMGQLLEMDESVMEKQRRLATLLMLPGPPTRQALIKDLMKYNVTQYVHPELQNLYRYLEVDFHPLSLVQRVTPCLEFIGKTEELSCYNPALEDIVITRVLKQVSQVYQTVEFSRFASLVPFATKFRLERIIVNAAKNLELQVRICHSTRSLSFGTNLGVSQKEDVPEGPFIQRMPSENIRNQLTSLAAALQIAMDKIKPENIDETNELRAQIVNNYRMTGRKEHMRLLQRRQIIEDRKEQLEHMNDQREKEEMEQVESQRRKASEAEMARLEREAEERKKQRQLMEHQEIKRKHVKERIEQLRKTDLGARIFKDIDEEEFAELDVDEIMAKQVEQLEKEKKELQERLKTQEKKVDFHQRALRLSEIPLLQQQYMNESIQAKDFWEHQEVERIEALKKERHHALETQKRLSRIMDDKNEFLGRLRDARRSDYEANLKDFEQKLGEERKRRLLERKDRRKEERRRKWIEEKEEAVQRAKDEALKREREEKEQLERLKREEEEREYNEKLAKLEEQAEKQRQREREIEEREAKRRQEESSKGDREHAAPPEWRRGGEAEEERKAWRPNPSKVGWREREKEREQSWNRPGMEDGQDDRPSWRERGAAPPRDDFRDSKGPPSDEKDFGDRGPQRDDRDFRDRGPPREERDFGDRGGPRDRFGDRGPQRDDRFGDRDGQREERSWRGGRDSRDDRGGWGRDGGQSDRAPMRDGWRDRAGHEGGMRDRQREDTWSRGGGRDEPGSDRGGDRGAWGRDREDSWRSKGPSRDDRGGPSDGGGAWRREDRGGDRDFRRGGDSRDFRRGGDDRDFRRGGDDRDFLAEGAMIVTSAEEGTIVTSAVGVMIVTSAVGVMIVTSAAGVMIVTSAVGVMIVTSAVEVTTETLGVEEMIEVARNPGVVRMPLQTKRKHGREEVKIMLHQPGNDKWRAEVAKRSRRMMAGRQSDTEEVDERVFMQNLKRAAKTL
ncbi:eukaryotic translation initiation factor 3 subunit A-like [Haliotis rubra]|uniref:eukaryotic translation initiation factor 3 subunit A-like n=1 Tax=Haliotis rubra TaxID=36100 RepID=UPI001EE52F6F|nr:eukaryotic translation initiation factor 3 subunit A-like [Haliotis rubra]